MRRVVLVVVDGMGDREGRTYNAVALARTPTFAALDAAGMPRGSLTAAGPAVGLPDGQIGNSEVGHLTLGAGRVVPQDLPRLNDAIADRSFADNAALVGAARAALARGSALHLIGLTSRGGVHSHLEHGLAVVALARGVGLPADRIFWHAILDGRDVPPRTALADLSALGPRLAHLGGRMASVIGRFYAMDRDRRWERIERAYRLLIDGEGWPAPDAVTGVARAYAQGEGDEFVEPIVIVGSDGEPLARIRTDDAVVFFNFRADRARELTAALALGEREVGFARPARPSLARFVCMTEYDRNYALPVAYPPLRPRPTLAEVVAQAGLRQLRVAETEKYAHVTYFFNGGVESPLPGEARVLVPSPRGVRTYDEAPAMNAAGVAAAVVRALEAGPASPAFILANFANPDMVGHTGRLAAAIEAVESVDAEVGRIVVAARRAGAVVIITADHGNCELMWDEATRSPHTAHTTSQVPVRVFGAGLAGQTLPSGRGLADIAPTVCAFLGIPAPPEWTGRPLVELLAVQTAPPPTSG